MTQSATPDPADAEAAAQKLLRTRVQREGCDLPMDLQNLAEKRFAQEIDAERARHHQEVELKEIYAKGLLRILTVQLAIADLVFIAFAWAGRHWNLPTTVVDIWLGAVVVQVLGVVTVVTRHLFPHRNQPGR